MLPSPHVPPRPRSTAVLPSRCGYAIREAQVNDLAETARLHVQGLPMGLFPRLGKRFVARWHQSFIESPHAVALAATHTDPYGDERVVGFLIGATDQRTFRQELLTHHRAALLGRGALTLIARPWVLLRFLRTRLGPYLRGLWRSRTCRDHTKGLAARDREIIADLTAIVIKPWLRRTGAGRELVELFLDRCAAAGTPTAELVTAAGPAGAAGFYERTGWSALHGYVTRDGLRVQRFGRRTDRTESD